MIVTHLEDRHLNLGKLLVKQNLKMFKRLDRAESLIELDKNVFGHIPV